MAKQIDGYLKLQVRGGQANPAPPVGPALGSKGINIMEFCNQFNARTEDRKGQVGSGDRSERIRTYNYPQGRVTDHRINLTLHKLETILEGQDLTGLIESLITEEQARQLSQEN